MKALSDSVQSVIVDLFMNIIRYESFLKAVSKDILEKQHCRNYDDLHQTMGKWYDKDSPCRQWLTLIEIAIITFTKIRDYFLMIFR